MLGDHLVRDLLVAPVGDDVEAGQQEVLVVGDVPVAGGLRPAEYLDLPVLREADVVD